MKAVIFDMDGVLVDSEPMHTAVSIETMAYYGVTIDENDMERFAGMTMQSIFSTLKSENNIKDPIESILARQEAGMLKHTLEDPQTPIAGIPEILAYLKQHKIPAAVASSSPKNLVKTVIDRLNIAASFEFLLSGEEVRHGKPNPEIYLAAAKALQVQPKDCVVIEDSKNGTLSAKAAGMFCIGFKNLNSGDQDLSAADLVVPTLRQVDFTKF